MFAMPDIFASALRYGTSTKMNFLLYFFLLPVKNPICRVHLVQIGEGLVHNEEWAMFMYDSMRKIPSGILEGNLVQLGNVEECLRVHADGISGTFGGRYCLVKVPLGKELAGQSVEVETAVCLPSTCSAEDIQNLFRGSFRLNATVNPQSCHSNEDYKPFSSLEWATMCIILFFLAIVIISTIIDCYVHNATFRKPWLLAFSSYTNALRLQSTSHKEVTFPLLHGLRTMAMCMVVLSNVYKHSMLSRTNDNNTIFLKWMSDWGHIWWTSRGVGLEIFMVMSGLLVSYQFLEARAKGRRFNMGLYVLRRYFRITPVFAVMLLVQATLLSRLGTSPRWHRNAVLQETNCRLDWWKMLLYVYNWWGSKANQCLEHTWFLAANMQLYLLSPLVLLPLYRRPTVGLALLSLLLLAGHIAVFCVSYLYHIKVDYLRNINDMWSTEFFQATYTRSVSWLIGLSLGYFLHLNKEKGYKFNSSPTAQKYPFIKSVALLLIWAFVLLLSFVPLIMAYPFIQEDYHYKALESALYLTFARSSFSVGVALGIALCLLEYGGLINRFLSRGYRFPISRLSFSIYIVHMTVVELLFYDVHINDHVSDIQMIQHVLYVLGYSIIIGILMTLLFEMPIINLQRLLFEKDPSSRNQQPYNGTHEDPPLEMNNAMLHRGKEA